MKLPARNTRTGTIMYWIPDAEALRILAEGPTELQRHEAARIAAAAEIEAVQRDIVEMRRLSAEAARVPGVRAAVAYMDKHDNDIIGSLTTPTALLDQEEIYERRRRISARHVDQGDAAYYSTPEEHIEYLGRRLDAPITGDAYSMTLLARWPAGMAIPDGDGYALEDESVHASASAAEVADEKTRALTRMTSSSWRYISSDTQTITVEVAGERKVITRRECDKAAAQWNGGDADQRALAAIYGAVKFLAEANI